MWYNSDLLKEPNELTLINESEEEAVLNRRRTKRRTKEEEHNKNMHAYAKQEVSGVE